jgi:uncharacterized protein (DUF488 family)
MPPNDAREPAGIFTIGHSTHPIETFIGLLKVHEVSQLADVRTLPGSSRHPHFNGEALALSLRDAGIGYRHFGALGGRRKPRLDSVNTGWRTPGFRGYADYIQRDEFWQALGSLRAFAAAGPTAVMCAEALWWQCHRRLLADALLVEGVLVRHILSAVAPKPHELSDFARLERGRVTYPGLL